MTLEKFKRFILLIALVLGVIAVPTAPVGAINVFDGKACTKATNDSAVCKDSGDALDGKDGLANKIVDLLLFAIGIVSVIMIIVGGLRYTTSNGDSSRITAAKNTILYSVIGLVVALLAFVIVNFVVAQFG